MYSNLLKIRKVERYLTDHENCILMAGTFAQKSPLVKVQKYELTIAENLTNQTLLKIVSLLSIHFKCPRMNETSTSNSLPVVSTMQWGTVFFRETFLIS